MRARSRSFLALCWGVGSGSVWIADFKLTPYRFLFRHCLYWNGSDFVPVSNPQGLDVAGDIFNSTSFDEVKTDKLRPEVVPDEMHAAGMLASVRCDY
jgi:hypothetical protein